MSQDITILVGLYGSGKSTILSKLNDIDIRKISLDELDITTRLDKERIIIIYNLFKKYINNNLIGLDDFTKHYISVFNTSRSLANTLFYLYKYYTRQEISDSVADELRTNVLFKSIIEIFIKRLCDEKYSIIVDSGAMHFLAMDYYFFKKLKEKFNNINVVILNRTTKNLLCNLFCKNKEHYAFLERGFTKDIYKLVYSKFAVQLPSDKSTATIIIESNPVIKEYVYHIIFQILKKSEERLKIFINYLDKLSVYINIKISTLNCSDVYGSLTSILKADMENILIPNKPKAVFFDLSSTILDSHAVDLEAINFVLTKYGLPTWADGTRQKKDNKKSMKENFPNFFGEELAGQAYKEYIEYLIKNIDRMPLIDGIIDTLKYCKENNIRIVMVSNRDRQFIDVFLKKFNLESYFDYVITPDEAGTTKPDPKIILPACKKFGLDTSKDTLLFVGDALADMNCAFMSGCIPVMFTKIVRDEISERSFGILRKINMENPIRIVKEQSELIELLEKSRNLWAEYKQQNTTKITYIGASGKIGKEAVTMICDNIPSGENVEIVLVGSGTEESLLRLRGFIADLSGALKSGCYEVKNIKFIITNDYADTVGSNIVLCSAAKWPTIEMSQEFLRIDPSGRTVQSFANKKMIEEIAGKVYNYSPNTLFVIATNQVDMLCEVARAKTPKLNIIGLSGGVDSSRLKQVISEVLGLNATGLIVGFHNRTMMPLSSSIKVGDRTVFPFLAEEEELSNDRMQDEFRATEREKLETIVSKTQKLGKEISVMQKSGLTSDRDTGASILPAKALSDLVNAYCFGKKIIESYNVLITDKDVAAHYGVSVNKALSIPLEIEKNRIIQSTRIPVLQSEKVRLREAQDSLEEDMRLLTGDYDGPSVK